jgi:hypothetical protein
MSLSGTVKYDRKWFRDLKVEPTMHVRPGDKGQ